MNELQQTVNARELHAFLESKQDLMIGLPPVLTNMDLWKIKILLSSTKKWSFQKRVIVALLASIFLWKRTKSLFSTKKWKTPKALVSVNFTKRSVTNERINCFKPIQH